MSTTQNNITARDNARVFVSPDELYPDEKSYRDKKIILDRQRESAKYRSISEVAKNIGTTLLPLGIGLVGTGLATGGITIAIGIAVLATAIVGIGTAIVTDYVASRKGAAVDIDKYEMQAQHQVRYDRIEKGEGVKIRPMKPHTAVPKPHIKEPQPPVPEPPVYEQNLPPASGKSWVQVARCDQPAEQAQGHGRA